MKNNKKFLCFHDDQILASRLKKTRNIKLININSTTNLDSNSKISLMGIELEKILIKDNLVWFNVICPKAILIWGEFNNELSTIIKYVKDFRGDELLVQSHLDFTWIAGHPRALVKWSASLFKIHNLCELRYLEGKPVDEYAYRLWWITRLNLRLFTLDK